MAIGYRVRSQDKIMRQRLGIKGRNKMNSRLRLGAKGQLKTKMMSQL